MKKKPIQEAVSLDNQPTPIPQPEASPPNEGVWVVSDDNYDMDTTNLFHSETGERKVVRQEGVGGTEKGSAGHRAPLEKWWTDNMLGGQVATLNTDDGKTGVFNRDIDTLTVGGIDKNLMDYIGTGTLLWDNYGAFTGENYEKYKRFGGPTQPQNKEFAQLVMDNPEPSTIISDESYKEVYAHMQVLRTTFNDQTNVEGAKASAIWLTDNIDSVNQYMDRRGLAMMNQSPASKLDVLSRIDGSHGQHNYELNFGGSAIDVSSKRQSNSFWAGVGAGWSTNVLQSSLSQIRRGTEDEKMESLMSLNPDIDPTLMSEAYSKYANGHSVGNVKEWMRSTQATRDYKQFEIDSKENLGGGIGLGVGEFVGNPINAILAHPLLKGSALLLSKLPKIVKPVLTGVTLGGTESLINDLTGGKNFTTQEIQHRAAWGAIGGGVLLSTFQLLGHGVRSFASRTMDDAKTPTLSNAGDEVNSGVVITSADDIEFQAGNTVAADNIETARIRSIDTVGADRVKLRQQEQTKIDRAAETASEEFKPEVTAWWSKGNLKSALKETYEEMGIKGHSKFTTKDSMAVELHRVKKKQAGDLKKQEIKQAKEDAKILADEKIVQDRQIKEQAEKSKVDGETTATTAKQTAQEALDLAKVNKQRVDDGLVPLTNVTEDGFEDGMTKVLQRDALEHAEKDAATQIAARESLNAFSRTYDKFTQMIGLRDMTTKGLHMGDSAVKYVAAKVLETGAGFAGRASRPATAALIKDTIFKREFSNVMGSYQRNMNEWAAKKGLNHWQNINARNVGDSNPHADEFHKTVYLAQERLSNGDSVGDLDPSIKAFLTDWDKTMGNMFDEAKAANVKGFGANKRAHYIPRTWKKGKVKNIADTYGEHNLRKLIKESVLSAQRKGKTFKEMDDVAIDELVDRQVNWINGLGDSMTSYTVGANARTKARAPLDMTVGLELADGKVIRMIDLVDTNLPTVASTYTQRTSGSIGLARATNGAIRDEADFAAFSANAGTPEAQQFLQDTGDMMFGYPTREGMNPAARMLMDSAQYAQLETLGVAQLATVGTSLQAVVANWVSHPEVAKKIMRMAGKGDGDDVMRSIRERSAVNRNMRFSNRADVHNLDQAQLEDITAHSLAMNKAVDKLTGGDLKPLLSRGLGKLSGYDAIAEYQSRLTQASFTTETARQVVLGKSSFSDQRLVDLGVKDIVDGKIVDGKVALSYKEHVEFGKDGELMDMHFDKWSDEAMREYTYAMNRYEAQVMPYIMAGELPQFMNMPEMQFALHYLKTPLAFGSKGTARQLGFADKEAAVAVAMNTLSAGLVRYAYTGGVAGAYETLKGNDPDFTPDANSMMTHNYLDYIGYLGEIYNKGSAIGKAAIDGSFDPLSSQLPPAIKQMQNMVELNPAAAPTLVPGLSKVITDIKNSITNSPEGDN